MAIIQLASDTLAGSASVGQIEYNGTIQTFTPLGTQRGVVPAEQYFRLNAGVVGANVITVQSIFGVGVTLSASTQYEFESVIALSKTAGVTSRNVSLGFGGTATVNNIAYSLYVFYNTSGFTGTLGSGTTNGFVQTAAATAILTASNSATDYLTVVVKGTVSVNAGGTFIPQYTLSAAPGGAYTTAAGSYIKISPIGVSGANISVGAWS